MKIAGEKKSRNALQKALDRMYTAYEQNFINWDGDIITESQWTWKGEYAGTTFELVYDRKRYTVTTIKTA